MHQVVNAPDCITTLTVCAPPSSGSPSRTSPIASTFRSVRVPRCSRTSGWIRRWGSPTWAAQTPQYRLDSINAIQNTPIPIRTMQNRTEVFGNMATLRPAVQPSVINHHNGQPVFDIDANAG